MKDEAKRIGIYACMDVGEVLPHFLLIFALVVFNIFAL